MFDHFDTTVQCEETITLTLDVLSDREWAELSTWLDGLDSKYDRKFASDGMVFGQWDDPDRVAEGIRMTLNQWG